jgi:response regulator RpfG family c-di-GMP phosphodiesterase
MTPEPPKARVLFVDDEPDLLSGLSRSLRSRHFDIRTVTNGETALRLLKENGPFEVIISDLRMPAMDGVTLLHMARSISPDTVRVLFTGQLDIEHALAAVNDGAIFRFMVKPSSTIMILATLRAAVEQYRLVTAERVLLEQTLRGSIQALSEVLALASPPAFGRASRLRKAAAALVSAAGIAESWHVEIAAMLSQIGCVTLPPNTLEKVYQGEGLSESEQTMLSRLPAVTEQILSHIPRLEPVLEILRYSQKRFDGTGPPEGGPAGEELPWGARALKVVLDLDALETEYDSPSLAFDTLLGRGGWYDPAILKSLAEIRRHHRQSEVREIPLATLAPGMVLARDVRAKNGTLYMARGQEITASTLEKLKNWSSHLQDTHAMRVVVAGTTIFGNPVT